MGKFGAAPNSDAERKAVECFGMLRAAEADCRSVGIAFGHAVVALREDIKKRHGRDFMARLKQLGISQEKARYWMAVVEGKKTNRHKPTSTWSKPSFDWGEAFEWLKELRGKLVFLRKRSPKGADGFAEALASLANALRQDIGKKGRTHRGLLQRKRQTHGSSIAVAHGERADTARGRR